MQADLFGRKLKPMEGVPQSGPVQITDEQRDRADRHMKELIAQRTKGKGISNGPRR